MKKEEGALIYSPSDLINFTENEFIPWMDRYYLEFPAEVQRDEDREEDKIFQKLGYQHEMQLLQRFAQERREVVEIQPGASGPPLVVKPIDATFPCRHRPLQSLFARHQTSRRNGY